MALETGIELLAKMARGEISAEKVMRDQLDIIRRWEPAISAFLHVSADAALKQAQIIDVRRGRGEPVGVLAGLPVAIKDILCTQSMPTTCGSRILNDFRPPYDASAVARLQAEDAILIGKTNLDEFAMGSSTENSAFQITRNPWDRKRTPGGSSGGSAAAVAAGEVPVALGTDTGGSIRQPAALCGVVGLKPTYGRVSRFGLVAFASSLDQAGPIGRSVADVALLLQVIAGYDPRDSTSMRVDVPAYSRTLEEAVRPLTLGVVREHFDDGLDPEVARLIRMAIEVYKDLGASVREISLPHSRYAVGVYYLVATAEASSNLARYDGVRFGNRAAEYGDLIDMYARTRGEGFGTEVKRRIVLGTYALSSGYRDAYYLRALKVRRLISDDYQRAFRECDVLIGPTSPTAAFRIGEKAHDPLAMYLSDVYTIGANLAGIPGISIPCGFTSSGLPVGLQILASAFQEEKLLRVARMYERAKSWHQKRPTVPAPPAGQGG